VRLRRKHAGALGGLAFAAVAGLVVALMVLPGEGVVSSAQGRVFPAPKKAVPRYAGRIVITDTRFRPATLKIEQGSRVLFWNAGRRRHEVLPVGKAKGWMAFVLKPGKTKALKLTKRGRLKFRIGKQGGWILVRKNKTEGQTVVVPPQTTGPVTDTTQPPTTEPPTMQQTTTETTTSPSPPPPPPPHTGSWSGTTGQGYALTFAVAGDLSSVANVHFHIDLGGLCASDPNSTNIAIDAPNWVIPLSSSYGFSSAAPFGPLSNANGTATGTISFSGQLGPTGGSGAVALNVTLTNSSGSITCAGTSNWTAG
jgi:plastocyanin